MISYRELTVRPTLFLTILSARLGLDWTKDYSLKDSDPVYLHPTHAVPIDMKLTLKAQPKKDVVSMAKQNHTIIALGNGSE